MDASPNQESILKSSLRALLKGFFSVFGAAFCIIGAIIVLSSLISSSSNKSNFSVEPDANGQKLTASATAPIILKIDISGIVGAGKLTTSEIQALLQDSREGLFKNDRVKGVLLTIDTPGGSVTDSNGIYEALKLYKQRYRVPIYAFVDGTCASGGMYISSAADKIYASPISIIGSVGVILGPVFNFNKLMENWGIQTKTISKGKDKAMLNPFTVWKPNEDASLHAITEYLYSEFINIVLAARPMMSREKLIEDYGAQVFAAPKALEYGYIDSANSSYSSTLKDLIIAAGIKDSERYQVIELKPGRPLLSDLFDSKTTKAPLQTLAKLAGISPEIQELKDPFLFLYCPH